MELTLAGHVEKFADIQPERVRLTGRLNEKTSAAVRIVPRPEHPFKITQVQAMRGEHIRVASTPLAAEGKPYYELTITSIRQEPGRIVDVVTIETDSSVRPQIQVQVFGEILPAQ